jgi:hypothetical protein
MTVTLATVAATVADEIKTFRSNAVTLENRSTPFARSLLASVVSGLSTVSLLEAAVIHAFGNPKNAKGKPIAKVSGLRDCVGGKAVYQTWKSFVSIVDCIDGDAPTEVEQEDGTTITVGEGLIRKAVTGFILGEADAPKTLGALNKLITDTLKAHYALTMPSNEEAEADNAEADADNAAPVASSSLSLRERAEQLLVAFNAADATARDEAFEAIAALFEAVDADTKARAGVEQEEKQLADA